MSMTTTPSNTPTNAPARHLSSQFDADLNGLASQIMAMGGAVEQQLNNASQALLVNAQSPSSAVSEAAEKTINAMEREVDAQSAYLIARRQPTAQDLRFVLSMLKVCNNLERMGDEAIKLTRHTPSITALQATQNPLAHGIYTNLQAALAMAQQMTRAALDALARLSVGDAKAVLFSDAALDRAYQTMIAQIVTCLQAAPELSPAMVDVLFLIKAVERVGDHAKNIAECVVYIAQGEDIRHIEPPPA
jgi:phosphate transport system protein